MRGGCIPGLTGKDLRNHRNIKRLDWSRHWDITLFSGDKHINVIIIDVDGQVLSVHSSRIPGYEELSREISWCLPLFAIKSITESPDRDACLHPMFNPIGKERYGYLWSLMYLSPKERKRYDAILMEDMWSLIHAGEIREARIYGVDTVIQINLDPLGRVHMSNIARHLSLSNSVYCILEDT